jgi:hypothetical protein
MAAYERQNGRCYYCNLPMWQENPASFARLYAITPKLARLFQCTAEHLTARMDGGGGCAPNIVAACHYCNTRRHRRKVAPAPNGHKLRVQRRMQHRRWHSAAVYKSGLVG